MGDPLTLSSPFGVDFLLPSLLVFLELCSNSALNFYLIEVKFT